MKNPFRSKKAKSGAKHQNQGGRESSVYRRDGFYWPRFFKHALGQHFLHDQKILCRIVAMIDPQPEDMMLEIGAGSGLLTVQLLPKLTHLAAVEIDQTLLPLLRANCEPWLDKLTIYPEDIMHFSLAQLANVDSYSQARFRQETSDKVNNPVDSNNNPVDSNLTPPTLCSSWRIVGNLPYHLSTPLLFHLLPWHQQIQDMHFMLQKEVGERLAATAGSSAYGRLSVMAQYYYKITLLDEVAPSAFTPPPKVTSVFVKLVPQDITSRPVPAQNLAIFHQLVRASFSARRKTLRNTMKNYFQASDWQALQLDPARRPEQLTVEDYVRISNYLAKKSSFNLPVI